MMGCDVMGEKVLERSVKVKGGLRPTYSDRKIHVVCVGFVVVSNQNWCDVVG